MKHRFTINNRMAAVIAIVTVLSTPAIHASPAIAVSAKTLSDIVLYPTFTAPAEVVSLNNSHISSQIQAVVKSIPVKVGQTIERDSVLIILDCQDYQLSLQQAEARLKAAKELTVFSAKQKQRAESLRNTSNISEELVLQRQTDFSRAQAEESVAIAMQQRAALDVSRCEVRSPFAGVVLDRLTNVGETAIPGTALIRILDLSAVEVSAQVAFSDIANLNQANDLQFIFESISYPLTLRAITASINSRARNQEIRLNFSTTSALPGSPGRLSWRLNTPHVSSDLLINYNDNKGIFIAEDNQAKFISLPEALEGRPIALNLPLTSKVIVTGQHNLVDGSLVEVSP